MAIPLSGVNLIRPHGGRRAPGSGRKMILLGRAGVEIAIRYFKRCPASTCPDPSPRIDPRMLPAG